MAGIRVAVTDDWQKAARDVADWSELEKRAEVVFFPRHYSAADEDQAATALTDVKAAITQLANDRATVGANITRLSYTSEQLGVLHDNLSAANSRIKDVDVADESTQFARYNILVQAGTAMLAQANANPQSALRLLQ